MPQLAWSDDLDTKIPELDTQHRVMIDHVNRVRDAAASGTPEQLQEAMQNLVDCVRRHFDFEEKVLEAIDFAGRREHHEVHEGILMDLLDYQKRMASATAAEAEDLIDRLGPWVVDHIHHDDLDFGPTVREWLRDAAPPDDPFRKLVGDS